MPNVIAILPANGLPALEDWNASLSEWQLDAEIRRWLPWTSEDGRLKVVVSVSSPSATSSRE
jgi:hypothetical protein